MGGRAGGRGGRLLSEDLSQPAARRLRAGLLLFDDVDLLDVGGPYEVLLTADRLRERDGRPGRFEVLTVSPDGQAVVAYGGLRLTPDVAAAAAPALDILLVPGAVAVDRVAGNPAVLDAIRRLRPQRGLLASVCTGALLLAAAGQLGDAPVTTHHEDVAELAALVGPERAHTRRFVDAGDLVTAGGLSSGIAMALHLVERVVDRELALRTAAQIEYDWDPDDGLVLT